MPLSYQGFGFTAIMIMLGILIINQAVKYFKNYLNRPPREKKPSELL
jgi:hypothetical protein